MKLHVITYGEKTNHYTSGTSTVIVIDVLRCTSAIVHALQCGAQRIVPVVEPGEAVSLAAAIGQGDCVLGGERNCNILPGFDVGNSPFEYNERTVAGKTVIISTTNGTNAICGMKSSRRVYLGAMSNCSSVARAAAAQMDDILIVCSGTDGLISADDFCTAGAIIERIARYAPSCELSDIAMICRQLYRSWRDGDFGLLATRHCKRLLDLGYGEDIKYCLTEDSADIVPIYADGIITA